MSSINMSIRIDKDLKKEADNLFRNLGLNMSSAITMFLKQSIRDHGIPFRPSEIPTERLLEALDEAKKISNGEINAKRYNNFKEIIDDIDKE